MPIYEYQCLNCSKQHELIVRHNDNPLTVCPDCGGQMKKLISRTTFVLKGTGWYVTDYASKDKNTATKTEEAGNRKPEKTAEPNSEAKSENRSENKTEPKPETKAEPAAKA